MNTETLLTPSPELKQHSQELKGAANNVAKDLKNQATTSYNAVKDEASSRLSDVQDQANDFADSARDFIKEHPFSAFGIGVLAGVLLTSWFRR